MPQQEFTSYFQRHDEVLTELEKATKRFKKLETVYKEFELQKVCYLPLNAFLLKPIQRLVHYRLLLSRLCGHYEPGHHDYADCRGECGPDRREPVWPRAGVDGCQRPGYRAACWLSYWELGSAWLPPWEGWSGRSPLPSRPAAGEVGARPLALPLQGRALLCTSAQRREGFRSPRKVTVAFCCEGFPPPKSTAGREQQKADPFWP